MDEVYFEKLKALTINQEQINKNVLLNEVGYNSYSCSLITVKLLIKILLLPTADAVISCWIK
jgi:hypothetical protein